MRDKIVHHYFKIDLDVVWETVKQDIPTLGGELRTTDKG